MAYDPGLVERIRDALARLSERGSRERGVFGGWGFLQGKSTFVIVWDDGIIAKIPADGYAAALARPGVIPFAPDGERPMSTWVVVAADAIADDPELAEWVALALQGVRSAPSPRAAKSAKVAKSGEPAKAAKAARSGRTARATTRRKPGGRGR